MDQLLAVAGKNFNDLRWLVAIKNIDAFVTRVTCVLVSNVKAVTKLGKGWIKLSKKTRLCKILTCVWKH